MKKFVLCGLLVAMCGCGRGWLPCLYRGGSCNSNGCVGAAPALPAGGCNRNCAESAVGYGSYEGEIAGSDYSGSGYYGGESIVSDGTSYGSGIVNGYPSSSSSGNSYPSGGIIANPPMSSLQGIVQPAP